MPEGQATASATDAPLSTESGSVADPVVLESATPATPPAATTVDVERFNGLMSSFNKEQAALVVANTELERLRSLLTAEVTEKLSFQEQLAAAGTTSVDTQTQETLTAVQSEVAGLKTQVASLSAKNSKLQFLVDNIDLLPYAGIIPEVADPAALETAVAAIRAARKQDVATVREHFTTPRGAGGTTPRVGGARSAAEIDAYLRSAKSNAEFEARFAEVTGKTK